MALQTARLLQLAHMARFLKQGELRVAMQLAAEAGEHSHAAVSLRQLAERTGCSKSHVQRAIADLTARGMIATTAGDRITAGSFALLWDGIAQVGGPESGPPVPAVPVPDSGPRVPDSGTPVGLNGQALNRARASIDFDSTKESIDRSIDRSLLAKAADFDPAKLAACRQLVHGYMRKFGEPDCPAPDDHILAQLLAVAPWDAINRLMYDLMAERKQPGSSPAWFVAVAFQRLRGISTAQLKARRDELRQRRPAGMERAEIPAAIAAAIRGGKP
ncbi:MAG TPA: helix-turn-helix domain-containing protein [Ktedonobacterales bacterium]|nr:helix-turn-helix domain-containing protein [Ktedonobacterales bacterium]